jgi:hypothetical protein
MIANTGGGVLIERRSQCLHVQVLVHAEEPRSRFGYACPLQRKTI